MTRVTESLWASEADREDVLVRIPAKKVFPKQICPTAKGAENRAWLGRNPRIPMMQPADLWNRDDLARFGGLDRPRLGAILAETKMSS